MSNTLNIAIADDEPLALMRICRLLEQDPSVKIVATCENGAALSNALRHQQVDAVFLDIEMPGRDGFSALSDLPAPLPRIVFVTAYPNYASQAFDIDATDYLLKPVSRDRLLAAVARVRRDLANAVPPSRARSISISIRIGNRIRVVDIDTIDHVVAQANYLEIRAREGVFVLRRPMSWMQTQLDRERFMRVHRSHIVRVAAIVRIEAMPYGRYRLALSNGDETISGRSYRDFVRETLGIADVST
jgi:two-component system, LytTR family, response regulator